MPNDESIRAADAERDPSASGVRVELRLLERAAPATRSLELLALAFGLAPPPAGVRGAAADVMAELIGEQELPRCPRGRRGALDGLLQPVVDAAVAACREANDEHRQATAAFQRLRDARRSGNDRRMLGALEAGAERLLARAAELLIVAHLRCEEAKGAARAVGRARRSRPSQPPDQRPQADPVSTRASGAG